tara:strand:- start:57 stop:494 length:438 start_codon:yes stop_codon:yes gene_type:complete
MDGDLDQDLHEVMKKIDDSEVVSLFFPTLRKAVVIDTRSNEIDGPMIRIMPMVASPQERVRSITKLRSEFPRVKNLTLIPWPRYVDSLANLGVWDRVVKRVKDTGYEEAVSTCEEVLEELRRLEKVELASVVRGENFHTIWSARA